MAGYSDGHIQCQLLDPSPQSRTGTDWMLTMTGYVYRAQVRTGGIA
jgi:hypothetical protein